jgi:hypothetical protein
MIVVLGACLGLARTLSSQASDLRILMIDLISRS